MNAAILAQLLIALGPTALELAPKLASIWTQADLTIAEVTDICKAARKSYDEGLAAAKARLAGTPPL